MTKGEKKAIQMSIQSLRACIEREKKHYPCKKQDIKKPAPKAKHKVSFWRWLIFGSGLT